jgi:hypothetical protein
MELKMEKCSDSQKSSGSENEPTREEIETVVLEAAVLEAMHTVIQTKKKAPVQSEQPIEDPALARWLPPHKRRSRRGA